MASLLLKNIYKVYPSGVTAVTDFNLDIEDKEFIIFVGPSGCGKSTTLRMIAGLEEISAGELYIDGKLMNNVNPKDRDIAFVFQSYALYPHMTVYDNMAFGLKLRKMPKDEIDARVKEAARILGIEMYLSRKPKALSGGQRQRVALGRAIVREPKVFLLDEPLSNLDAKLRAQMRTEITKLHNRLATTFIYVTHDQIEAMTMGTRIVVMKDGFMQQVDTPQNLYDFPINKFVAGFIGSPQMNFFDAVLTGTKDDVKVELGSDVIALPKDKVDLIYNLDEYLNTGKPLTFGIRPEDLHDDPEFIAQSGCPTLNVKIELAEMLGAETQLYCKTQSALDAAGESIVDDVNTIIARVDNHSKTRKGDEIVLALDLRHCHFFDKETEMSIMARDMDEKNAYESANNETCACDEVVEETCACEDCACEDCACEEVVEENCACETCACDEKKNDPVEEVKDAEIAEAEAQLDEVTKEVAPIVSSIEIDEEGRATLEALDKSFTAKIIQSPDEVKKVYSQIKNSLLALDGVKDRTSWDFESFNKGRLQCAKLNFKGKTLAIYVNLDPNEYSVSKYHHQDVSSSAKYASVPMMIKIKSDRALKYALELIDELAKKHGLSKGAVSNETYYTETKTNEELLAEGLIKPKKSTFQKK